MRTGRSRQLRPHRCHRVVVYDRRCVAAVGLNGTQLYNDRESITQALRSGAPVIAAVRPGTFTNVGHYIVLYGIDDANQIGVYDPNSASRSARRWGVVEVLNEVEAMWAYY